MASEDDELPVPRPEPAKKGRTYPEKGSPAAKAWAAKMTEARAAKRAARGEPTSSGSRPLRAALPPVSGDISIELTEGITKLGALLLVPAPVVGTYTLQTGEELALIVARMAERNPKLLAMLQGSSNIMDYIALGAWGLGFVAAVGVQVGRVPADAPLARTTGITSIVNDLESSGVITVDHGDQVTDEPAEGVDQAFAAFEIPTPPEPVAAPVAS